MEIMSNLSRRNFIGGPLVAMAAVVIQRHTSAADGPAIITTRQPNSLRNLRIPRVAGRFINIYKPQADVFTLPTVTTNQMDGNFTYTQGATYPDWRTNDHTFIKGPDNRWHCFGITKPWMSGDNGHSGEGLCFHAIAPERTFVQAATFQSWRDLPKIHVADCGWAPTSIKIGQEYSLIGSHLGHATSTDLKTWTDKGRLSAKGGNRDPHIMAWNGTYYLTRCDDNGINQITSKDFINWSEPKVIYKPERKSYQTESPVLVAYDGLFYLFWTLWDTEEPTTGGYCPRSYVHCSESPDDFCGKPALAEFTVHAPEIIQAESGQWFMSSTDHPHRGISVAPLVWE
jgi:arabinan endo-1,5-alpha-L-arabinosidase